MMTVIEADTDRKANRMRGIAGALALAWAALWTVFIVALLFVAGWGIYWRGWPGITEVLAHLRPS
jgi:hypothetical protein